jgi:hypothetical protein
MHVWDFSWASFYAFSAASALFVFYQDSAGFLAYKQGLNWASLNAGIIFALCAQMGKICSWNQHENPYSRCLWPNPVLMTKRTGNFTFAASAAS